MRDCPEAAFGSHGLADRQGKCPYCGKKTEPKSYWTPERHVTTNLVDAYREVWDPDFPFPQRREDALY